MRKNWAMAMGFIIVVESCIFLKAFWLVVIKRDTLVNTNTSTHFKSNRLIVIYNIKKP